MITNIEAIAVEGKRPTMNSEKERFAHSLQRKLYIYICTYACIDLMIKSIVKLPNPIGSCPPTSSCRESIVIICSVSIARTYGYEDETITMMMVTIICFSLSSSLLPSFSIYLPQPSLTSSRCNRKDALDFSCKSIFEKEYQIFGRCKRSDSNLNIYTIVSLH